MKKLLIGFLFVIFSGLCFSEEYAYKLINGKVGKFRVAATEQQATEYRAEGYSIVDKMSMYKLFVACGQENQARLKGVIPSDQEAILAETTFGKLEIREVFDSIILVEAVPATETTPAVAQVTLGDLLTQVLESNPKFKTYWNDADRGIDITYPTVVEALAQFPVTLDITALKLAILQNRLAKGVR